MQTFYKIYKLLIVFLRNGDHIQFKLLYNLIGLIKQQMNLTLVQQAHKSLFRNKIMRLSSLQHDNKISEVLDLNQLHSSQVHLPLPYSTKEINTSCTFFNNCQSQLNPIGMIYQKSQRNNAGGRRSSSVHQSGINKPIKINVLSNKKNSFSGQLQTNNSLSQNKTTKTLSEVKSQSFAIFNQDSQAYLKYIYEQKISKNAELSVMNEAFHNPENQ